MSTQEDTPETVRGGAWRRRWTGSSQTRRGSGGSPAWLVSFTDLVALLLAFFVLLFSMSRLDIPKWQDLARSLQQELLSLSGIPEVLPETMLAAPAKVVEPGAHLDYLASVVSNSLANEPRLRELSVRSEGDGLVIELLLDQLFAPRSETLEPSSHGMIEALGKVLRGLPNEIIVRVPESSEGVTTVDSTSLALLRAATIAHTLGPGAFRTNLGIEAGAPASDWRGRNDRIRFIITETSARQD